MSEQIPTPQGVTSPTLAAMGTVTACLIVIGNEILSGRTRDSNIQFLAKALGGIGIRLREVRVVADEEEAVVAAVNACRVVHDYVFTTGGIGPTHDDITAVCIAKAFGVPIRRHADALARLEGYYGRANLNAARLKMADLPDGARLIDNPVSTAPGFELGNVLVLAGVPRIAEAMFDGIRHRLRGGPPLTSRSRTAFLREGDIAAGLSAVQDRFPEVEIGSYPFVRHDRIGVTVVARSSDAAAVATVITQVEALMRDKGGDPMTIDPAADEPVL